LNLFRCVTPPFVALHAQQAINKLAAIAYLQLRVQIKDSSSKLYSERKTCSILYSSAKEQQYDFSLLNR